MKFKYFTVAALCMAAVTLTNSCVGSFSLFNKLAAWNKDATGNKFLNEIIFLVISPAYGIVSLADVLIFNTIEFWSGDNPMASNIGKTQQILGNDGKYYAVKTLKNGYEITKPNGEMLELMYNKAENSWSMIENGKAKEIFRFNEDGTIKATLPNGSKMDVSLNEQGVYQVRMAVNDGYYWAAI